MATSKEKVRQVIDFLTDNGEASTLSAFGISNETLSRYKRLYRSFEGSRDEMLSEINERFSDEELKILLKASSKKIEEANVPILDFKGDEITLLCITDTHWGSIYSKENLYLSAIEEGKRRGANAMIHAGDVVEGLMNRPNHVYECDIYGYANQKDYAISMLKKWKEPIYFCTGNHDMSINTKLGAGISLGEDIVKEVPNAEYVGEGEGMFYLEANSKNRIKVRLFHGTDSARATSLGYRLQQVINSSDATSKSDLLITGHDHKSIYVQYQGTHALACGSMQLRSSFMTLNRIAVMPGFWIIKLSLKNNKVNWIEPRWYPF